jgi:signal transduction histidine kinase
MESHPELVDMREVVAEVVEDWRQQLAWNGCTCVVRATDENTVGRWDRLHLRLIVTNLLSNAAKYGAGRPIEIELAATDSALTLSVRDRGPGLAASDQSRIFERYARGANVSATAGFGLGLWIVQQVVTSMRGRITVQSELGAGATFVIELPREGVLLT